MNRIAAMVFTTLFLTLMLWCTSSIFPSKAIHAQENFSCDNVSEIPQTECEVLVAIRTANPSANTVFYSDPWLQTLTPCEWDRITCENGHVTELQLYNIDYPFTEGLTTLPSEIGNLSYLTSLALYGNALQTLPPEIGNLSELTTLEAQVNNLASLPAEIFSLTNLTSLHLAANQLTSVPAEIGMMVNLENLNLSDNDLTEVPAEIGMMVSLESLELSQNDLAEVPAEIADLTNLTSLSLDGNELISVPTEFSNLGAEVLAQLADDGIQIEGVVLDCASVSQIPQAECEALVAIRNANPDTLFTGGWAITDTPCSWTYVTCSEGHVSELMLHFDIITNLPPEIGNLTHLTVLDLDTYPDAWICRVDGCKFPDHNKVATLPPEIGNLASLVTLDLEGNDLTSLPPEIGNLINLQTLDLSHNALTTLPSEFGNLLNLTELDLNMDTLTSLPPEMYNIPGIENMDVDLSLVQGSLTSTVPSGLPSTYLPIVVR